MNLGDKIKLLRKQRGWSHRRLADETVVKAKEMTREQDRPKGFAVEPISFTTIGRIERGQTTNPGLETLEVIARALGVTSERLLSDDVDVSDLKRLRAEQILSTLSTFSDAEFNIVWAVIEGIIEARSIRENLALVR